ncbi:MAG TPA: tetratricopeptide repeat protein [Myxococcaceae bacterium]|nr:tetratricopeptide repeat protein [Myxococcaceae bacterium]
MELHPPTLVALLGGTAVATLLALLAVLSRKGRSEDEARAYLAGFTYVLSDDPDAAIAELSKAAQLNTQTLETYFALGALFRRKGELDRAIRLHRNILLRPGLAAEVRRRAQLALALDYKRSGLRDKASESFEKLLEEEPRHRDGLLHYRRVLEESRQWERAAALQNRLVELDGTGQAVLAHLLAEWSRMIVREAPEQAESLSERAVALVPDSADAQLALGEARIALRRERSAASPLQRAVELEPELAPRTVRLLASAFAEAQQLEQFFKDQVAMGGPRSAPFELALALLYRERGSAETALEHLRRVIERWPQFWEARKALGALLLSENRSEELRADYREILATLGKPALGFGCASCRQKLPEHLFRCPSCEEWDTVRREE